MKKERENAGPLVKRGGLCGRPQKGSGKVLWTWKEVSWARKQEERPAGTIGMFEKEEGIVFSVA